MKVGINISLTLSGSEFNISLKEAKELNKSLSDLFKKLDGVDANENKFEGMEALTSSLKGLAVEDVAEFETENSEKELVENRDIQDAMIDELNSHEDAISTELEELKKRTQDMNNLIANYSN